MNEMDRERVKELLSRASALPAPLRRAYIEQNADSPNIAAEALDLLSSLDDSGFLNAVTGAGIATAVAPAGSILEGPGTQIGRYKLLQRIGEGGFGTVFMAEQTEPVIRRVALKIIKAGMDTKAVIARFEAERQALAMMDHPNIARVLDAGATATGRPYFVMELVRGEPLTKFCDIQRLPVNQRLTLFQDICAAVQHAHQKGIIHRDLKPTNVLVTLADGRPLPKVIDFGIAKATAIRLTDKTLFTELHQLVGTPQYMSPEQAEVSGIDIDTRSDVYSLGVLLYELLAGEPPFESRRFRTASFAEIQRIIRDEEPPRPSVRLRTMAASSQIDVLPNDSVQTPSTDGSAIEIANRRQTEPMLLAKSLRGDLDWIVMKCLEKDRSRRYDTASALADDVSRYLANKTVSATPPSPVYRLRKTIQRNRGAVIAAGVITFVLIAATAVSIGFAVRASRALAAEEKQRKLAEKSAAETTTVAQFQSAMLAGIDVRSMGAGIKDLFRVQVRQKLGEEPVGSGAIRRKRTTDEAAADLDAYDSIVALVEPVDIARQVVDNYVLRNAIEAVGVKFKDQPRIRAELLTTLGKICLGLGLYNEAEPALRHAVEVQEGELRLNDTTLADSLSQLAGVLTKMGRAAEAEQTHRRALAILRAKLGDEHPKTFDCLNDIAVTLAEQGKIDDSEAMLRDALVKARRLPATDQAALANVLDSLGELLRAKTDYAAAEPLLQEALSLRRRFHGPESEAVANSLNNLAKLRLEENDLAGAEPLFREALDLFRKRVGTEHIEYAELLNSLSAIRERQGDLASAETFDREALDLYRRLLGNESSEVATMLNNLAMLLQKKADYASAEPLLREAMNIRRRRLGEDHPDYALTMTNLAVLLRRRGDPAGAEPLYRQAIAVYEKKLPPKHPWRLAGEIGLARCLIAQKKTDEAEPILTGINTLVDISMLPVRLSQGLLEASIEFYDAKVSAAPNQGFEEKAADARTRLANWKASTQPAAAAKAPRSGPG